MALPNIIFLDMDGVLCTPRACVATGNTGGGFSYLDPIACLLVRNLCEESNAKIVVSSAWRIGADRTQFSALLGAACPNLDRYVWGDAKDWRTKTAVVYDQSKESDRGAEILEWIKRHETDFNNFVILDDMADMRPLQQSLVQCHYDNGIGLRDYYDALTILKAVCE